MPLSRACVSSGGEKVDINPPESTMVSHTVSHYALTTGGTPARIQPQKTASSDMLLTKSPLIESNIVGKSKFGVLNGGVTLVQIPCSATGYLLKKPVPKNGNAHRGVNNREVILMSRPWKQMCP